MKYAEVAVNAPGSYLHSFSYSIPPSMAVQVGHAVWAPFGPRIVQGIVTGVSDSSSYPQTRDLAGLISPQALVSSSRIELAKWIAGYYLSPLFNAVALMLPPGFERRVTIFIQLKDNPEPGEAKSEAAGFIQYINDKGGGVGLRELERTFGKKLTSVLIKELTAAGTIEKAYHIESEKVKPKLIDYVKLNSELNGEGGAGNGLKDNKLSKQAGILELLAGSGGMLPLAELRKSQAYSRSALTELLRLQSVSIIKLNIKRDPLARKELPLEFPLSFTDEQQSAWNTIKRALDSDKNRGSSREFILHGVTGSGKTEIYLRALSEIVMRGKKGICLVPEIALTPQMIERFYARFPGRVAVLHSRLAVGEQYDQWHSILKGEYDVVIGSRSAIFAPQPDLGLIVVDEEHEWAYKQSAPVPRYHARDAACKLAELSGAVLILGSATPDVQTYYKGLAGRYTIIELKERAGGSGLSRLPEVSVVDMRAELKAGSKGLFSRLLKTQFSTTLERNEQVILYINRRGQSTYIECSNCGYVIGCKRCSAPLAYHASGKRLVCHHCNRPYPLPAFCPQCSTGKLKYLGTGTERVEQECVKLFPRARIVRFDSDAITNYRDYERIVKVFKNHEADILIGTQMLAKGLDFPYVTLVGVINADIGLGLPDFRAAERTFQLLCQVSGRAGRGHVPGQAIIQTFNPAHYAIKYAASHDYAGFYREEIRYRQSFGYPPFSQMIRMVYNHSDREKCWREAELMSDRIKAKIKEKGMANIKIVGPASAYLARLRGKYQVQVIIFGEEITGLVKEMNFSSGWALDVDPLGVV